MMKTWAITDTGLVRKENQDTYRISESNRVCVVCDLLGGCGVGGAQRFQRVLHGLGGVLPHLHQRNPEGFQIAVVLFANAHCFVPPCINRTGRRCSPRCACPGAC